MPEKSAIFAAARLSSLENKFLGKDRLKRMLDSTSAGEALKVLYEVSYADGMTVASVYDYEQLLEREELILAELIRQISPDKRITDCFTLHNDYHNAKVFLKAKYGKITVTEAMLSSGGSVDREYLKNCIAAESYLFLPEKLAGAIKKADAAAICGALSPAYIDLTLDAAYGEELSLRLKKLSCPLLDEYFHTQADLKNLETLIRLRKLGVSESDARGYFMPNGTIPPAELMKLYALSNEAIEERLRYTKYKEAISVLLRSVSEFERWTDNYLLAVFRPHRRDYFNINPVIGYYLGKKTEMKNIRIIMTALLNGMDKELAEQRLRDSYV